MRKDREKEARRCAGEQRREKENFKCNYSNNKSVIVSWLVKRLRGWRRLRGSSPDDPGDQIEGTPPHNEPDLSPDA